MILILTSLYRAKKAGFKNIYISTDQKGLYENFGFTYLKTLKNRLGSSHPRHKEMIYPMNYGYVDNLFAADGDEQDVYVFGSDKAIEFQEQYYMGELYR